MTPEWFMATDLRSQTTFVVERCRRGGRKLRPSRMTARGGDADVLCLWRELPLYIRQAARATLSFTPPHLPPFR
jgi:hypothetical protein